MRKVTSAIEGMSVAEVRRGLDAVRTKWASQPPRFYFTDTVLNDMTVQQFCTAFTLGHHTKRHAKSKRALEQDTSAAAAATAATATTAAAVAAPAALPPSRKRKHATNDDEPAASPAPAARSSVRSSRRRPRAASSVC